MIWASVITSSSLPLIKEAGEILGYHLGHHVLDCATKAGLDHFSRCAALDEALLDNPAQMVSIAPGVIDTDMQTDLRSGNPTGFPDQSNFIQLKQSGSLTSPADAAARLLAFLARGDFGSNVVADVRD